MNNLKVGDKVRCIADITGGYAEVGAVGIIKNSISQ